MTALRRVLLIIFILLLLFDLFIWIMAIGSGHTIPPSTTQFFLISALVLLIAILVIYKFIRKRSVDEKG